MNIIKTFSLMVRCGKPFLGGVAFIEGVKWLKNIKSVSRLLSSYYKVYSAWLFFMYFFFPIYCFETHVSYYCLLIRWPLLVCGRHKSFCKKYLKFCNISTIVRLKSSNNEKPCKMQFKLNSVLWTLITKNLCSLEQRINYSKHHGG